MTEQKISPRIANALRVIEEKDFTQTELQTFYINATSDKRNTEEERELVVQALEKKIRVEAPRIAKKLFGPKDTEARELLQKTYDEIALEYDLSANRVGAGVKTGGDMIAGRAYISVYFSYKNDDRWNAGFGFRQDTAGSEPKLIVKLYQGGESNQEGREYEEFEVVQSAEAADKFKEHLERMTNNAN